jgi:1,4-dihydroxy-2-naphthoyl-CoA hydrolase
MAFVYQRTVRFSDTDAAGVVYFANVLSMCHETYEASLAASEIDIQRFFSGLDGAIPIVHAHVDFLKPMHCGDRLLIHLTPKLLTEHKFEIHYEIYFEDQPDQLISQAVTQHICIDPAKRLRVPLPVWMTEWIERWGICG